MSSDSLSRVCIFENNMKRIVVFLWFFSIVSCTHKMVINENGNREHCMVLILSLLKNGRPKVTLQSF
jgi:hypothetical protein